MKHLLPKWSRVGTKAGPGCSQRHADLLAKCRDLAEGPERDIRKMKALMRLLKWISFLGWWQTIHRLDPEIYSTKKMVLSISQPCLLPARTCRTDAFHETEQVLRAGLGCRGAGTLHVVKLALILVQLGSGVRSVRLLCSLPVEEQREEDVSVQGYLQPERLESRKG